MNWKAFGYAFVCYAVVAAAGDVMGDNAGDVRVDDAVDATDDMIYFDLRTTCIESVHDSILLSSFFFFVFSSRTLCSSLLLLFLLFLLGIPARRCSRRQRGREIRNPCLSASMGRGRAGPAPPPPPPRRSVRSSCHPPCVSRRFHVTLRAPMLTPLLLQKWSHTEPE